MILYISSKPSSVNDQNLIFVTKGLNKNLFRSTADQNTQQSKTQPQASRQQCFLFSKMSRLEHYARGILTILCFLVLEANALRVAFWTGYQGHWSGRDFGKAGIAGSELALLNIAELLAVDNEVDVYVLQDVDYQLNGVRWRHQDSLVEAAEDEQYDVMIISRYINYFIEIDARHIAKRTIVWIHDVHPHHAYQGLKDVWLPDTARAFNSNIDMVVDAWVAVSKVHKRRLVDEFGFDWEKVAVIPNGLSNQDFEVVDQVDSSERVTDSFVYSSCPKRSLNVVLDMFPKITDMLPNATLSFYYKKLPEDEKDLLQKVADQPNVHERGFVNHEDLMKIFARSDYWLYPTTWWETCCTTAMEVALGGPIQITSTTSALQENVKGIIIPGTPGTAEFEAKVLDAIKHLNENPEEKEAIRRRQRDWAIRQTWRQRADMWRQLLSDTQSYSHQISFNETMAFSPERWERSPLLRATHGEEDSPFPIDTTNKHNHPWYDGEERAKHDEL